MATRSISILRNWLPQGGFQGRTVMESVSDVAFAQNAQARRPVTPFTRADGNESVHIGGRFVVPNDYVDTPELYIVWGTRDTDDTLQIRVTFSAKIIAAGESLDPSSDDESVGQTVTVPSTTAAIRETTTVSLSAGYSAGAFVVWTFGRDGTHVDDDAPLAMYVEDLRFRYQDA